MRNLAHFITEESWEHIALVVFVHVDDAYQVLVRHYGTPRTRGPAPDMSDSEVITCAVRCERFCHGRAATFYHFLAQYMRALFPHLLDRSQFNRRRRALLGVIENTRRLWRTQVLPAGEDVRLIDSAPVPVCTYARSNRCRTVQGAEFCGVMTVKKAKFFGFRLHVTTTPDELIDEWLLAPASDHDVRVAPALLEDEAQLTVIGDAAYTSAELEQALWDEALVVLLPLRHPTQHAQWSAAERRTLIRARMRVETALSQLTILFDLGLTGARSLVGVVTRVASKILAHTFCFLWPRPDPVVA